MNKRDRNIRCKVWYNTGYVWEKINFERDYGMEKKFQYKAGIDIDGTVTDPGTFVPFFKQSV